MIVISNYNIIGINNINIFIVSSILPSPKSFILLGKCSLLLKKIALYYCPTRLLSFHEK